MVLQQKSCYSSLVGFLRWLPISPSIFLTTRALDCHVPACTSAPVSSSTTSPCKAVPTLHTFLACLMLPSILGITFLFLQAINLFPSFLPADPSVPLPFPPGSQSWHDPKSLFWKTEVLSTENCTTLCIWCSFLELRRLARLLPAPNPQGWTSVENLW